MNRRTMLKTTAWSVPVIAVAATAPAYAASSEPVCAPVGYGRKTGEGTNTKDYFVSTNCTTGGAITAVEIKTRENGEQALLFHPMVLEGDQWAFYGSQDSAIKKTIRITFASGPPWVGEVEFPVIS